MQDGFSFVQNADTWGAKVEIRTRNVMEVRARSGARLGRGAEREVRVRRRGSVMTYP